MDITPIITHHFVKSEDLNHHGTLFAGRTADWFVETGLMAVAVYISPENIVCLKIHGMSFTMPIKLGETARFTGKVVYAGRTSIIANIRVDVRGKEVLNGFITFVNVDKEGRPFPHGLKIQATSTEDIALQKQAEKLRSSSSHDGG